MKKSKLQFKIKKPQPRRLGAPRVVKLSPEAELRYQKIDEEFSSGKNVYSVKTAKELKALM